MSELKLRTNGKPRRYGYIKDAHDPRDQHFMAPRAIKDMPPRFDLREGFRKVPVEDQGDLGSCTANALAGMVEYDLENLYGQDVDVSRLFIYYNERKAEGTVNEDAGAQLRTGIKCLAQLGVCPEPLWPYDVLKFASKPTEICYERALDIRAKKYQRIVGLHAIRTALYLDNPVVFGFQVYESFESDEVAKTGRAPLPKRRMFGLLRERCLGGHAVLAVGYDDTMDYPGRGKRDQLGCLICRNSWGSGWGDKGYFYLPYPFITNPNLSDDFWTVVTYDIKER